MPKFDVEFSRSIPQYGTAIIEADSMDDAYVLANEMLDEDSLDIDWDDNFDAEDSRVETIQKHRKNKK